MTELHLDHDWFPSPLPNNVLLGERSWLYSSYALRHFHSSKPLGLKIGSDTGIYDGTFFDLGPSAEVTIGNYCSIVGAIFSTNGRIEVGDMALVAHEVVLAEDEVALPPCHQATRQALPRKSSDAAKLTIGQNVWIGARAILLGNLQIGEGAVIGAATLVTEDVPPYTVFAGNPGRVVKELPRP